MKTRNQPFMLFKILKIARFFLSCFFLFLFPCILYSQPNSQLTCGPKSLLVVLQKIGVESSLEEIFRLSGYTEKEGTTMLGLYQAAESKGLYAEGVKISLDYIANLKTPVIAYLWGNYFLVVEGTGTDTLIITDSPKKPQPTSKEEFRPLYSGFSLLISKDKISLPKTENKKADIRFDSYTYDFGKVKPGRTIEGVFTFRNVGTQNLYLSKARTTCGCTEAIFSSKIIPPKGKGKIKVNFATDGRTGPQDQLIYVHSNDPITPISQLHIRGTVEPE